MIQQYGPLVRSLPAR
ncbi:hypothetical protein QNN00_12070 [Bacillus velezensis]|nr:hypothetical protein [Bacillus velezensis]